MRGGVAVDDVTGVFWPEYHRADASTLEGQSWFGEVKVVENLFVFSRPVFKLEDGDVSPAEMKAKVRHTARKEDGSFVVESEGAGIERVVNWLQPVVVHDEGTNLTDIRIQLNEMRAIFRNERAVQTFMIILEGIQNVGLNGNTRAVRFKINQGATSGIVDTEIYVGSGWQGMEV
jgi:carbon monoxide dehydrogenase subunit G